MYELTWTHFLVLPVVGLLTSMAGTLVGLGGGFILVPVLLLLFPEASPATVSSISLTVVLLNASSATIGNLRTGRIDFRTASLLVVGALPFAVLGAIAASYVSRDRFEVLFGGMLLLGALYVFWRSLRTHAQDVPNGHLPNREIHERRGPVYRFYVNSVLAGVISPIAGFISSFFGIGGGVIHVPALTFILRMPMRIVGATALFVLVPTSLAGLMTRLVSGDYHEGWRRAGLLGLGALFGAQLGLVLGTRVSHRMILVTLAVAMALVGAREVGLGI